MVPPCWKPFNGVSISLRKKKIKPKLLCSIKSYIIWPWRTSLVSPFCSSICWSSHTGLPDSQTCQTLPQNLRIRHSLCLDHSLPCFPMANSYSFFNLTKFDFLREAFPNLQSKHYFLFVSVIELPVYNYTFVYMLNFIFTTM